MTSQARRLLPSWSSFVGSSIVGAPVPRDHQQSDADFARRRWVAVATLVVGAGLLGWSLRLPPGDRTFYLATALLATCWVVGALLSGPLHLGYVRRHAADELVRPWSAALILGLGVVALFAVGALVIRQLPPLREAVNSVLDHARFGSFAAVALIAVVNGLAEELFFRGALFAAIGRRAPVLISTAIYTLTTVAAGNAMLVFAAFVLGLLVALQRRVTGGLLAPMITHLTWSLGMLFLLPPILG